ncbi:MAG: hypothetical protein ACOCU2_00720 [Bacillota bacterium]
MKWLIKGLDGIGSHFYLGAQRGLFYENDRLARVLGDVSFSHGYCWFMQWW